MDAEGLRRSLQDTRRALIYIAYGPPLRFDWREAIIIAVRDMVRQRGGGSASRYRGYDVPATFTACRPVRVWLAPAFAVADFVARASRVVRHARAFNAGIRTTRSSARMRLNLEWSA